MKKDTKNYSVENDVLTVFYRNDDHDQAVKNALGFLKKTENDFRVIIVLPIDTPCVRIENDKINTQLKG